MLQSMSLFNVRLRSEFVMIETNHEAAISEKTARNPKTA